MTEQALRQWGQLFAWTVPLIIVLGIIGMTTMLALLMAWRRSTRRWSGVTRLALHRRQRPAHLDAWTTSARRMPNHDDEPGSNPDLGPSPLFPSEEETEIDPGANVEEAPWLWQAEPEFGEADEDAPWRQSLDDLPGFEDEDIEDDDQEDDPRD